MRDKLSPLKILCFVVFSSAFPIALVGQANTDSLPIYRGIDKFILGSSKAVYEADIGYVEGGVFTWRGATTYTYQYCPVDLHPFLFLKIPFNFLALTFDEDNKLITSFFTTLYADDPQTAWVRKSRAGSVNKATKDYRRFVRYFNRKWGEKGKTTLSERFSYSQTKWKKNGSTMILRLSWSNRLRKTASVSITLTTEPL